jgi:hypothetical protein
MSKAEADRLTREALNTRIERYSAAFTDTLTLYRSLTEASLASGEEVNMEVERKFLEHLQYCASLISGIASHFLTEGKVQATILGLKGEPKSNMLESTAAGRVRAERVLEGIQKEVNAIVQQAVEEDAPGLSGLLSDTLPPISKPKPSGGMN